MLGPSPRCCPLSDPLRSTSQRPTGPFFVRFFIGIILGVVAEAFERSPADGDLFFL
jgi:hypothetical protein